MRRTLASSCMLSALGACSGIEPPHPEATLHGREAFITRRAERLRGLPYPPEVELVYRQRGEFRDEVKAASTTQPGDADSDAIRRVLQAFGLLGEQPAHGGELGPLLGEAIQGFYEPEERRLSVVLDEHDRSKESTFSHEVIHAIEDGRFDLAQILRFGEDGNLDAWLARRCIVEGSATLHQLEYLLLRQGYDLSSPLVALELWQRYVDVMEGNAHQLVAGTGLERDQALSGTPDVAVSMIILPYVAGARLLRQVKARGGVAAVDRTFEDLPRSTEQVLHPDKYLEARDEPLTIDLPDLGAHVPGRTQDLQGTLGEFLIRYLLRDADRELWSPGWSGDIGWEGDRFAVAHDAGGVFWRSEWESADAARSFAERLGEVLAARQDAARAQAAAEEAPADPSPGTHCVRQEDRTVLALLDVNPAAVDAGLDYLHAARVSPHDPERGWRDVVAGGLGLIARVVHRADGASRFELLRGLLGSYEARPGGFDLRLAFGGALHLEATPDRFLAGLAFDWVNLRRNVRNGTGSVTLLGLCDPSWSDDAFLLNLALSHAFVRSSLTVDQRVHGAGILPGLVTGYTRVRAVDVAADGTTQPGALVSGNFNLALSTVLYHHQVIDAQPDTQFRLLWGLLYGQRWSPEAWRWWTPLLGWKGTGSESHPTLFWGLLDLGGP